MQPPPLLQPQRRGTLLPSVPPGIQVCCSAAPHPLIQPRPSPCLTRGQVEELAEVLNPRVSEEPVVVAPGIALSDILLRLEGLHQLDHLQVGHIDLGVLGQVEVLLGKQHALCGWHGEFGLVGGKEMGQVGQRGQDEQIGWLAPTGADQSTPAASRCAGAGSAVRASHP